MPFTRKIFISSYGKIYPCENTVDVFSLGQVNEKTCDLNYKRISRLYDRCFKDYLKFCINCYCHNNCDVCMLMSLMPKKKCENFMNLTKYKSLVTDMLEFCEKNIYNLNKMGQEKMKFSLKTGGKL
jgi:uncharacterized protein